MKKEIMLFYILLLVSAGIVVTAKKPAVSQTNPALPTKCSKLQRSAPIPSPFNSLTDGILRYKA